MGTSKAEAAEEKKPQDADQERYRAFFKIEDSYLIQYKIDETKQEGFIVFLDKDNDVDWAGCGRSGACRGCKGS